MPFLSPLPGDDADDYYYGYDAGYRRGGGSGTGGKSAKKDKGIFSCLPCFIPICDCFSLLSFLPSSRPRRISWLSF